MQAVQNQFVPFVVVVVGGFRTEQEGVARFAAADFADAQFVQFHSQRQADAFGQFGRTFFFGRCRFGGDVEVADGQVPDVEEAV